MAGVKRPTYPQVRIYTLPPDPRRKSSNLMILHRLGPRGPLEVVCCNSCFERGTSKMDGSCRHTDILIGQFKPWWRQRARPVQSGQERQQRQATETEPPLPRAEATR